jgi:hypothetical protein
LAARDRTSQARQEFFGLHSRNHGLTKGSQVSCRSASLKVRRGMFSVDPGRQRRQNDMLQPPKKFQALAGGFLQGGHHREAPADVAASGWSGCLNLSGFPP